MYNGELSIDEMDNVIEEQIKETLADLEFELRNPNAIPAERLQTYNRMEALKTELSDLEEQHTMGRHM